MLRRFLEHVAARRKRCGNWGSPPRRYKPSVTARRGRSALSRMNPAGAGTAAPIPFYGKRATLHGTDGWVRPPGGGVRHKSGDSGNAT
jgi:hypothetical protein